MQLSGNKRILASVDTVYRLLTDPDVLMRTMPGLKTLTPTPDGKYAAEMEMGVAAIKGKYQGSMEMVDPQPPHSYRLVMTGQGPGGYVEVNMTVEIVPDGESSTVRYNGEVVVGGTIASLGQRVFTGVANYLVNQFFAAIAKEAERQDDRKVE